MEENYDKNKWSRCNSGIVLAGVLGFVGFRIWEIVDLWAAPPKLNRRYRQLTATKTEAFILPQTDGGSVGLQWRF